MIRSIVEATEFAMAKIEEAIDDRIGRPRRKILGRYLAALTVGVPIAFAVPGFRWSMESTFGLIAGLLLLGAIDCAREMHRRSSMRR